jgi:hypothetical protein
VHLALFNARCVHARHFFCLFYTFRHHSLLALISFEQDKAGIHQ